MRTRSQSKRCCDTEEGDGEGSGDNVEILARSGIQMDTQQDSESDDDLGLTPADGSKKASLFNAKMVSYLVQMMSLEVNSGRTFGGLFNKTTWPRIHKKFNRFFKVAYSLDQITAKYRRIKKDYQTFQYLKAHIGFGWNAVLQVPTAPDSTWENVIWIRHNAPKFKKHTLPHYEMLHKIFGGSNATGQFVCNSTQQPIFDVIADDAPYNSDDMSMSTRNTGSRKGKPSMTASHLKKKGRKDVYDTAMAVISEGSVQKAVKDATITRVYETTMQFTTPAPPTSDPECLMEILWRLKESEVFDDMTFARAEFQLESLYHRRAFTAMKDPARIAWIKLFSMDRNLLGVHVGNGNLAAQNFSVGGNGHFPSNKCCSPELQCWKWRPLSK